MPAQGGIQLVNAARESQALNRPQMQEALAQSAIRGKHVTYQPQIPESSIIPQQ